MWTVRVTPAEQKLTLDGKHIEKVIEEGLVTIEWAEGVLIIRFFTAVESGFGLRL